MRTRFSCCCAHCTVRTRVASTRKVHYTIGGFDLRYKASVHRYGVHTIASMARAKFIHHRFPLLLIPSSLRSIVRTVDTYSCLTHYRGFSDPCGTISCHLHTSSESRCPSRSSFGIPRSSSLLISLTICTTIVDDTSVGSRLWVRRGTRIGSITGCSTPGALLCMLKVARPVELGLNCESGRRSSRVELCATRMTTKEKTRPCGRAIAR